MSNTEKFRKFVGVGTDDKLVVDDAVTTVPGIADGGAAKLAALKVTKVGELMGLFMTFNLDKELFITELVDVAKMERRFATEAADALYEKALQFCSHELPPKVAPSGAVTGATATLLAGKLSTQPLAEGYVPGLGAKSIEKLAENNVKSCVQLMGEFLLKKRSRAEFLKLLTESGGLRAQDLLKNDTDGKMLEKALQFCR